MSESVEEILRANETMYKTIVELKQENILLKDAIRKALDNIGIPQPGYPAPVGYAYDSLSKALAKVKTK